METIFKHRRANALKNHVVGDETKLWEITESPMVYFIEYKAGHVINSNHWMR